MMMREERSGGGCMHVLMGLLLTVGSVLVLWWNEGRSVATYNTLVEAEGAAVPTGDGGKLTPGLGGRLVFIHGVINADGQDALADAQLGVTLGHGIKLKRRTEMYQYKKERDADNKDLVQYRRVWSEVEEEGGDPKSPGHKKYKNPGPIEFPPKTVEALTMKVDDFQLEGPSLRRQVDWYRQLPLVASDKFEPEAGRTDEVAAAALFKGSVDVAALPPKYRIEARDGNLVTREPSREASVGDVKVTYYGITEGDVSVLAETTADGKLREWTPKAKGKMTSPMSIVERGTLTLGETIRRAVDRNTFATNLIRGVGTVVSVLGWYLTLSPIELLVSFIPIFGGLASALVGCGICTLAFALGISISVSVISFAWLFYRPLVAVPMLFLCFAVVFTKVIRPLALSGRKGKAAASKLNYVQMQRGY